MTLAIRMILILALVLPIAGELSAQETATETSTAPETSGTSATVAAEPGEVPESVAASVTLYEIRNQFSNLLREHPAELQMILKLDPGLLSNETFVAKYPELARFLEKHPEVRRNPHFYLAQFRTPGADTNVLDDIVEMLAVFTGFGLTLFAFIWLVRTIVEQKRWNRLSRTQSEVHNKILDRFSTSNELLDYIRTPAGTKFLESAPIPLRSEPPAQNAPLTRIMWSIQIGVVVVAGGLGLLLVSLRFDGETAQGLFALGAIALCVGAGFIVSALVSVGLSRRLGLWQAPGDTEIVK